MKTDKLTSDSISRQTRTVRSGIGSDEAHGAVIPPLHLSTTFTFEGLGQPRQYDYTRSGNPTRDQLSEALAALEGGSGATVTSSGMSAVTLALQLLQPGDLLLAPKDCYGGTYRAMTALSKRGHFEVRFFDPDRPEEIFATLDREPRMLWIETPSNPLLRVTDIEALAGPAKASGAVVVVDNTFLSPVLQRPIEWGADLVVHSTTKYLNGHSDVVGGTVVAATPELHEELAWWGNCLGLPASPFDCYLTLRGLRTLHARMTIHEANAAALVDLLESHPAVRRVWHPSLPGHPGHAIARRQQDGFGAMIGFELQGGLESVDRFTQGLEFFSLAESLGGVESLVAHPATMTHAAMDPWAREEAGIGESLLRLSVGIEAEEDLRRDLESALERALRAAQVVR